MRRGFLLPGSDGKSSLSVTRAASGAHPVTKKLAPVEIPCGRADEPLTAALKGHISPDLTYMIITVMPPPSLSHPWPDPSLYTSIICFSAQKDKLLSIPGFPMPLKTPSPLRYRILQPADGRYIGLGMFATADFDVGDLILQERALLITTQFIPPGPNGYSAADAALHMAVYEQMLPACRTAYLSLSNSFPSEQQEITGILNTNALYIGALPGYDGACGGVFNDISRINHSCCPNAVFRWDLASFSGQVHALAPVRCGEQIYLSYVDMCNPRKVRQQLLLDKYKFHCTCASCMLRGAGSQYSDLRRAFIAAQAAEDISERKTDDDVLAWTSNPALPERMLVDAAEIWLAWMLEERVMEERLCRVVLSRLCKAYAALEDEEGVKRCARHAAALEKAWIGHDGGWLAVAANPRNTLWWGLRTMPRF